jgi:hypothetical protein
MNHNECYGNMFPSVVSPRTGVVVRGKVFSIELQRAGGLNIAVRRTEVDLDAWKKCLTCQEFDSCYKLSMAKLALDSGVLAYRG